MYRNDLDVFTLRTPTSAQAYALQGRNGAQLILLAALGTLNTLLSLGCLYAFEMAPHLVATVTAVIVGLLWSLWIGSLKGWFRGEHTGRPYRESELAAQGPGGCSNNR